MPAEETQSREVMTTGQVAKLFRVAPRTVSKWFDRGILEGYRIPDSQDRRLFRDAALAKARELGLISADDAEVKTLLVGGWQWCRLTAEAVRAAGLSPIMVTSQGDLYLASQRPFRAAVIDLATYGRGDGLSLGRQIREHVGGVVLGLTGDDEIDPAAVSDAFTDVAASSEFSPERIATFVRDRIAAK